MSQILVNILNKLTINFTNIKTKQSVGDGFISNSYIVSIVRFWVQSPEHWKNNSIVLVLYKQNTWDLK